MISYSMCMKCIWKEDIENELECLTCNKVEKAGQLWDGMVFGDIKNNYKILKDNL